MWRCKRCHNTQWIGILGRKQCAACDLLSDVPDAAPDDPNATVRIVIECDACGHRESALDEAAAHKAVFEHVKGCRKAHKGLVKE